jgi:hypothetical protein
MALVLVMVLDRCAQSHTGLFQINKHKVARSNYLYLIKNLIPLHA